MKKHFWYNISVAPLVLLVRVPLLLVLAAVSRAGDVASALEQRVWEGIPGFKR